MYKKINLYLKILKIKFDFNIIIASMRFSGLIYNLFYYMCTTKKKKKKHIRIVIIRTLF